jgi:hypothetical protein
MGSGKYVDHDKSLQKIQSIARANDFDKKSKIEAVSKPEEKKCTNCNNFKTCKKFKGKLEYDGVYSVGGETTESVCDKWKQTLSKQNTQNIKSLLKQFSKKNR